MITLNRPKALNALNHNMIAALNKKLIDWRKRKQIKAVIIQGAGDRAFCAGGDIRQLYEHVKIADKELQWVVA